MLRLKAYGKINWTLDILSRRADGYHLMDMLLQTVELSDTLWLEPADELTLAAASENGAEIAFPGTEAIQPGTEIDALNARSVPYDESNLAYRAAALLKRRYQVREGARMRLHKLVPSGAGMGGGSADAAAALTGLNRLWKLGLDENELRALGLELGADVPFMLAGGLMRVGGIGERLTPLTPAPEIWLTLTQPCGGLSTREIFTAYDASQTNDGTVTAAGRPDTEAAVCALKSGDLRALALAMGNVLEPISAAQRPALKEAVRALEAEGALRAMMTGSGSVVYGVFSMREAAEAACEQIKHLGPCWVTRTLPKGGTANS